MASRQDSHRYYKTLISPSELNGLMVNESLKSPSVGSANLVVLDARFNLADTEAGRSAYLAGHIPGAVYVHLDAQLSSPVTPITGRHPMPDLKALASWFSSVGVQQGKQIVVYDDMAGAMAARCWWLLKLLGYSKVAVLDGGFPQWEVNGFSVENSPVELPEEWLPPNFADCESSAYELVSTESVLENVGKTQFLLVDARTPERFAGEQEPIDPIAGHVPGALNRPLQDNLINGCFKSADQLRTEWSSILEGRKASDVVHMCGSGVTACHNLLAMEHAGLLGSKVYAGSWSEWIRNPQHPIAQT